MSNRHFRSYAIVLSALTSVVVLGAAIQVSRGVTDVVPPKAVAEPATAASVLTVSSESRNLWQSFSGRFEAVDNVDVRPRVSGEIRSTHFVEGSLVKAGDILFQIDPDPYQAELDRLSALLGAAETRLAFAETERNRAERLWKSNTITESARDQRFKEAAEAASDVGTARASLRTAQLNMTYTTVRAPISGRVGRREIAAGNLVDAGSNALVLTTIVSVNPIYASFEVREDVVMAALQEIGGDLSRLKAVPVEAEIGHSGTMVVGSLQFIDNRVDALAGTVRVRATFDNQSGAIVPGQFTRIRLGQARQEPVIQVPEQAIGTDQNRRFLMVLGTDNRAVRKDVQLGQFIDGMRVVLSGLSAGERVIVNNLQRVRAGTLIEARDVTNAAIASN